MNDLSSCTVKMLRDIAASLSINGRSKMRKAELIAAIEACRDAAAPARPSAETSEALARSATGPISSSSLALQQPSPSEQEGPEPGLPIPEHYDHDRLVLMVQDPKHLFAYWEIRSETLERIQRELGGVEAAVLIVHSDTGSEQRLIDLAGGNYYLAVRENCSYHAQIALRDRQQRLHILLESGRVHTPAAALSTNTDEAWMAVDEQLHTMLDIAQLPEHQGLSSSEASRWARERQQLHHLQHEHLSSHHLASHSLSSSQLHR